MDEQNQTTPPAPNTNPPMSPPPAPNAEEGSATTEPAPYNPDQYFVDPASPDPTLPVDNTSELPEPEAPLDALPSDLTDTAPTTEMPADTLVDTEGTPEPISDEAYTDEIADPTLAPTYDYTPVPDPLAPPPADGSGRIKLVVLSILTLALLGVLIGSIWFFFLRTPDTPVPTPTPTVAVPTPTEGPTDTHLECRFGLCVEVPGPGENICSSSFDCEQAVTEPTVTPEISLTTVPTPTPSSGGLTATPTPQTGTPLATSTPTPTLTPTPLPTVPTATPTPLASNLPVSGTTETTLLILLGFIVCLGAGAFVLRHRA